MLLSEPDIRESLRQARAAFPNSSEWEYNNEINASYSGFTLWGEFTPEPDGSMPRTFFVTFDTDNEGWMGHLSIGQHYYFWTSADYGDAYLVDTDACESLGAAITSLKRRITKLLTALTGSASAP